MLNISGVKKVKKEHRIIAAALFVLVIFSIGYYLRAYIQLHKYLPYSPYEVFTSMHEIRFFKTGMASDFADKAARYPTVHLLAGILNPIFGNLYLVYILGAIVIFFLGKEISHKNFGGLLAFSIYALAPENLLQYTKTISSRYINNSGMSYVFMWAALLFLIRYLKKRKYFPLVFFIIFSLLTLTSYHTAACALVMLLIGLWISLIIYSLSKATDSEIPIKIDKKFVISSIGLIVFYMAWIRIFDPSQVVVIKQALLGINNARIFIIMISFLLLLAFLFLLRNVRFLRSEFIPLIILFPSAILIFSNLHFFQGLLRMGVKNYYSSAITLNNYVAQALLVHVYILLLLPVLFKKETDPQEVFLRGWLIGLTLIFSGLTLAYFYARIFDYSFPLMSVLFGLYWCKKERFRMFIISVTLILLIISQLRIYNDPFTMRRYYNRNEIDSAKKIIVLNLGGAGASDLRTAALFSYLGKGYIEFGRSGHLLHDAIFYEHRNIPRLKGIDYFILSESMRNIVYSTDFETTPVDDKFFEYYKNNFNQIYNDGLMYVYEIKPQNKK